MCAEGRALAGSDVLGISIHPATNPSRHDNAPRSESFKRVARAENENGATIGEMGDHLVSIVAYLSEIDESIALGTFEKCLEIYKVKLSSLSFPRL